MNLEHADVEYVKRTDYIENRFEFEKCKTSFKSEILLKKHINFKHPVLNTESVEVMRLQKRISNISNVINVNCLSYLEWL